MQRPCQGLVCRMWGNRFVFIPRTTSTATATTQDYELAAGFQPDIKAKKTLTDVLSNAALRNLKNRVRAPLVRRRSKIRFGWCLLHVMAVHCVYRVRVLAVVGKYFFHFFLFSFFFHSTLPFLDANLHVSQTSCIEETRRSRKNENHTRIVAVKSDLKAEVAGKTPAPCLSAKEKEGKSGANPSHRSLTNPARSDRALKISSEPCCYNQRSDLIAVFNLDGTSSDVHVLRGARTVRVRRDDSHLDIQQMPFHQAPFGKTTIGRPTLRFFPQALHFEGWAQREFLGQRRKSPARILTLHARSNRINNGSGIVERSSSTEVGIRIAPLYTNEEKTLWWHGTDGFAEGLLGIPTGEKPSDFFRVYRAPI